MSSGYDMGIDTSRRNVRPRPLTDDERARLEEFLESIHYSSRYSDSEFEYRHVQLPKAMLRAIPKEYHDSSKGTLKLLWEDEWRSMGITQSLGWEHYEVHEPEPHILLFKYVRLGSRPALSWMYRAFAWLAPIRSRNQLTRVTGGRSTTNHLHNEGSMNTMAAVLRQHVYLISHSTTA
ncbi:cyclin-dependent kinase regulatory subunit [Diaporthe eres]|uniref:Cyclin-dependent kinases regulatory subunit n=1 Tax=Diaporthe vaccinii TaxID=105482 RepID=A0ABR4EZZ5_9PEZI|nr:cyclin-dependent kinase regulatory subunit [Diaporthe eres]